MSKRIAVFVLLAGFAIAAPAQLRTVPAEAKRGKIEHVQEMIVAIDGVKKALAPGAQIRDASNRLVLPVAIPAGTPMKYLLDADGMVSRVWILTPQEAAQADKQEAAQADKPADKAY
jgi:hypothetical protein